MARAAGDPRRQATRAGLLTLLSAACAVIQEPPGGPPDFRPPSIVRVTPDSGAVVQGFRDRVRIEFDEVVSERSGGGLDKIIRLSPRPRELDIRWHRTAISVKPEDGWRPNAVYQVTLLPGIQDLSNNRLDSGRTIVFATGGEIPDTRVTGTVIDWEQERAGAGALIEAVWWPDSLVYLGRTDSAGDFALGQLPRGRYTLYAVIDQNNNRVRDLREAYDSVTVTLDSALHHAFWTYSRDTVGPQLRTVTRVDSVTVRLEFSRFLDPRGAKETSVRLFLLPDTVPVAVGALLLPAEWDSLRARHAQAAGDTLAPAAAGAAPARVPPRPDTTGAQAAAQRRDSTNAERLLATRPRLIQGLVVRLAQPLAPGSRYLVEARAVSVARWAALSRRVLVTPAARDST